MEYIKQTNKVIKLILIFAATVIVYFSTQYRPATYPSIQYAPQDSPYLSPEGWPLPEPVSFK